MCIRRETREKARRSLAFSRVSKPHTHITHMLRQCTGIVYLPTLVRRHPADWDSVQMKYFYSVLSLCFAFCKFHIVEV
jgi:hypothetical protein